MADNLSTEFRAWHDKVLAEEKRRFGPLLDAMLLEAQSLRLQEGHKARERTLGKLDLVISKLDDLNIRFEDARNDAREARTTAHADSAATRANVWVVGLGLAVLIVAVAALFPVFFSIGAQLTP